MAFTKQDFQTGSDHDVWQIVPTAGEPIVGPVSPGERFLIVHEYREQWSCRVHHEIPYGHIARRMKLPAEVAAALDAPAPGANETPSDVTSR